MSGTHGVASVAGPEGTREGLRAIRLSAGVLFAAAAAQLTLVAISGSAGLFAAGLDNLGDVVSTIALAMAFSAARRAADRRYTFGYERLEDLAGVVVCLVIWGSAAASAWQSFHKLHDHEVTSLYLGMGVALVGAAANEVVAQYKSRVGRKIGSEPLVADGKHARTDALASIAAFAGLLGVKLGASVADPIAGLVITLAIVAIAVDATRHVLARLLDAIDPEILETVEHVARGTPGVSGLGRTQARWAGRSLYVNLTVAADPSLSLADAHDMAEAVHHRMIHELPFVAQVDVHVDPGEAHAPDAHAGTAAHDDDAPASRDPHGHGSHGDAAHDDAPASRDHGSHAGLAHDAPAAGGHHDDHEGHGHDRDDHGH